MEELIEEIADLVNHLELDEEISADMADCPLAEIGFTSMDYVRLTLLIEENWGLAHMEEKLFDILNDITVRKIAEKVFVARN